MTDTYHSDNGTHTGEIGTELDSDVATATARANPGRISYGRSDVDSARKSGQDQLAAAQAELDQLRARSVELDKREQRAHGSITKARAEVEAIKDERRQLQLLMSAQARIVEAFEAAVTTLAKDRLRPGSSGHKGEGAS